jgi:phage-related protein
MPKKGYKQTEEHKIKSGLPKKGKYPKNLEILHKLPRTEEWKKKISESEKGKIISEKTKEKLRQFNLGRKYRKETRLKMSKAQRGEKSHLWKGGISFEPYSIDWTEALKRSIRERDHYTCQICNQYGNIVHHIDYNKKNCSCDNLITLCNSCHTKTNHKRDYWNLYLIFAHRCNDLQKQIDTLKAELNKLKK